MQFVNIDGMGFLQTHCWTLPIFIGAAKHQADIKRCAELQFIEHNEKGIGDSKIAQQR
ncbi:MAG: hypothetical protein JKY14_07035 [Paraglaciecola sp.]|nr:hypothetical protein [Paraglaciecola sp.]